MRLRRIDKNSTPISTVFFIHEHSDVAAVSLPGRDPFPPSPERRYCMTPLRQRMMEDMQLRGFSARTQECYVAAVRQLAEHYHRSPDLLAEQDLRQYFLFLASEKKVDRYTATTALCRIKFF